MNAQTQPVDAKQGAAATILIVIDESTLGQRTATLALSLARRIGARAVVHLPIAFEPVVARSPESVERALNAHRQDCEDRAKPWFDAAMQLAQHHGVACSTMLTIDEKPCDAVRKVAREQACSLIAIGSHGRGTVTRALTGSLVADLVRLSDWPVLVCREDMPLQDFGTSATNAPGA